LRAASVWKTRTSIYMPPPTIHHARIAPKGPVATPKVPGREKIPAPTIKPTTIAVNANREIFRIEGDVVDVTPAPLPANVIDTL